MLIAMAGLQGVGKTTVSTDLARRLSPVHLSVDPIESALHLAGVPASFERGLAAYRVAEAMARENLRLGASVVIDACDYVTAARRMWVDLARHEGVPCVFVEVRCTDVAAHRARVGARHRALSGLAAVTWVDVERRRTETEPWGDEVRVVVDTALPVDVDVLIERIGRAARPG